MYLFLNPTFPLHLDLDVVDHFCLHLSNSGETTAQLEVLLHLTRRWTRLTALFAESTHPLHWTLIWST